MAGRSNGWILGILAFTLSVVAAVPPAMAQQKADLTVLRYIPADAAFVVVVPGIERFGQSLNRIVHGVLPKEMGNVDVLDAEVYRRLPLGQGLDRKGSFAAVLLDPRKADPEYVKRAGKDEIGSLDSYEMVEELPIIFIAPVTDAKTLFKDVRVVESAGLLEYKHGDETVLYGKAADRHIVLALRKSVLGAWSNRQTILTKITAGMEKALTRQQIWFWADRNLLGELRVKGLLPLEILDDSPSVLWMVGMPPMGGAMYLHYTRDELFREATSLSGGMAVDAGAILFDARWTYPADSEVGKKLKTFQKPAGPLIRNMPPGQAALLYGADKSAFTTPVSIKRDQYEKLMKAEPFRELPQAERKKIVDAVATLQEQVVTVEHYAGPNNPKDRAFAFATVIRCKSSKTVMAQVETLGKALKALFGTPGGLPMQVQVDTAAERIGTLDVAEIRIVPPMPGDEVKKTIADVLGEQKVRVLAVAANDSTVVTTFGGGMDLLKQVVQIAQGPRQTELEAETQAVARLLPANRAAEVFVNPHHSIELLRAITGKQGEELPLGEWTSKKPFGGALVIDRDAVRVSGVIPLDMVKGYFDLMMARMGR